jgi:GNAT superfamily N-acetyltransferase
MVIRNAQELDAPRISSLVSQLGFPLSVEEVEDRINAFRESVRHALLVAEEDGVICGLIAVAALEVMHAPHRAARVSALIVDASVRRKGIGKKLIETAERLACAWGCNIIEVTSGARRAKDGAHTFYENMGYVRNGEPTQIYFSKPVSTCSEKGPSAP